MEDQELGPDEAVFEQNELGDALYVVAEGTVHVVKYEGGDETQEFHLLRHKLAQLGPGTTFGERALLEREPRFACVRCAPDSAARVSKITRKRFEAVLHRPLEALLPNEFRDTKGRVSVGVRHASKW